MPVYYRNRQSGKIEGKYIGCDTQSVRFRDGAKYDRFVSEADLPLQVRAEPSPIDAPKQMMLKSSDGSIWQLTVDNGGKVKAAKVSKKDA